MRTEPGVRRRRLSLTPLIDVIFLLLLFFMLSSTFSNYGEIELTGTSGGGSAPAERPWFLQLGEARLTLNGTAVPLGAVAETVGQGRVLVSLDDATTSQRLVDLLAALRGRPGLTVTVLR